MEIDGGVSLIIGATDGSTEGGTDSAEADGAPAGAGVGPAEPGERKMIWPETQSINGLWRASQLYPSTAEQAESRGVTYSSTVVVSPEGKEMSIITISEMTVPEEPSNRRRPIGGIETRVRLFFVQKTESMKQWDEPESIRVRKPDGMREEWRVGHSEFGSERAEALSHTKV